MKELQAIHASKKVSRRNNPNAKMHPELDSKNKGWNFSAGDGVHYFPTKKDAEDARKFYMGDTMYGGSHETTVYSDGSKYTQGVGKIRNGRRRIIDSTYGLQGRYQGSSATGRVPKDAVHLAKYI